jgi:hypothetical protein
MKSAYKPRPLTGKQKAAQLKRVRNVTKGMTMERWENPEQGGEDKFKYRNAMGLPVDEHLVFMCKWFVRDWRVQILVNCKAPDGSEYIEEREIEAENVRLNELTDFFLAQKEDALASVNSSHVLNVGWIAKALN